MSDENNIDPPDDNDSEPEKERLKRRKYTAISKSPTPARLLNRDRLHIEKQVRKLKPTDPNFASESAAIRHYVALGIEAEKTAGQSPKLIAKEPAQNSLNETARDDIAELKKIAENAIELMQNFEHRTGGNFAAIVEQNRMLKDMLEDELEHRHQAAKNDVEQARLSKPAKFSPQKKILSLEIVFEAIHKTRFTHRIEPELKKFIDWGHHLKRIADEKIDGLSEQELIGVLNVFKESAQRETIKRETLSEGVDFLSSRNHK